MHTRHIMQRNYLFFFWFFLKLCVPVTLCQKFSIHQCTAPDPMLKTQNGFLHIMYCFLSFFFYLLFLIVNATDMIWPGFTSFIRFLCLTKWHCYTHAGVHRGLPWAHTAFKHGWHELKLPGSLRLSFPLLLTRHTRLSLITVETLKRQHTHTHTIFCKANLIVTLCLLSIVVCVYCFWFLTSCVDMSRLWAHNLTKAIFNTTVHLERSVTEYF